MDTAKMEELTSKVMTDVSGAIGVLLSYIGDQAGVYAALDGHGPCSVDELATVTDIDARYLIEFLSANAALGYVTYDTERQRFSLSPEQAVVFAHEGDPSCMQGFFQTTVGQYATHDIALEVFTSGRGRPWAEHHACCFCGTDRFFRPGYVANLIESWIPSLDGVAEKLQSGAVVADVGCGLGSSTVLMAEKFPNSTIHGFDFHEPSIEQARGKAEAAGLGNVEFFLSDAKNIPHNNYDFACIFDALHDMGDPVGAAGRIRQVLNDDGTFMLVEPMAGDSLAENLHTLGAIFYGFSTLICVPTSRAQEVGLSLGAQAGEKRLTEVLHQAGFTSVRRSAETPTNMVLEARP